MKGKILIVLAVLMMVTGMILASCDNGAVPKFSDDPLRTILDQDGDSGDPSDSLTPDPEEVISGLGLF